MAHPGYANLMHVLKHIYCPELCATGNRSATGATTLAKAGFKPVYNITGGMIDWKAANMPVKQGKKGSTRKRVGKS